MSEKHTAHFRARSPTCGNKNPSYVTGTMGDGPPIFAVKRMGVVMAGRVHKSLKNHIPTEGSVIKMLLDKSRDR